MSTSEPKQNFDHLPPGNSSVEGSKSKQVRRLIDRHSFEQWLSVKKLHERWSKLPRREREWVRRALLRERKIASDHARRAKKRGTSIGSRDEYRDFVQHAKEAKRIKCYWCKKAIPKGKRTIDHIVPIAKGGADHVHNLCVACPTCNYSKNDKTPEQWCGQGELAFTPVADVGPSRKELRRQQTEKRREEERSKRAELIDRYGSIVAASRADTRSSLVPLCFNGMAYVPLTHGAHAVIAAEDYEKVCRYQWSLQMKKSGPGCRPRPRAKTNINKKSKLLSQMASVKQYLLPPGLREPQSNGCQGRKGWLQALLEGGACAATS